MKRLLLLTSLLMAFNGMALEKMYINYRFMAEGFSGSYRVDSISTKCISKAKPVNLAGERYFKCVELGYVIKSENEIAALIKASETRLGNKIESIDTQLDHLVENKLNEALDNILDGKSDNKKLEAIIETIVKRELGK